MNSANNSTNTPSRSTSSPKPNKKKKTARLSGSNTNAFTLQKQDRQARNKEPDDDEDDSSDDEDPYGPAYDGFGNESYNSLQIRREAISVLDNPELLMMHAQARNDSIPSTRLHFLSLLSGRLPSEETQETPATKAPRDRQPYKMRYEDTSENPATIDGLLFGDREEEDFTEPQPLIELGLF